MTRLHFQSPCERLLEPQKNLGTSRGQAFREADGRDAARPLDPGEAGAGGREHPNSFCVVLVNRHLRHNHTYNHRQDKPNHSQPKHSCSPRKSGHIAQCPRGSYSPSPAKHNDSIQWRRSENRLRRHYHHCGWPKAGASYRPDYTYTNDCPDDKAQAGNHKHPEWNENYSSSWDLK